MTSITSALIVIIGLASYQIGIKLVPEGLNPVSMLLTIYVSAFFFTLIASQFFEFDGAILSMSQFSWFAVLVGIAIVGVELGFLFMYRNGWTLAAASLVTMGGSVIILLLFGILVLKQPWSARYLAGVAMCVAGIYLLTPQQS